MKSGSQSLCQPLSFTLLQTKIQYLKVKPELNIKISAILPLEKMLQFQPCATWEIPRQQQALDQLLLPSSHPQRSAQMK